MPIYAYRCESCGHAKDVLQKVSDPVLTTCPACSAETFKKQLTAAGFQLKGSGWYATDFRGGNNASKSEAKPDGGGEGAKTEGAKTDGATSDGAKSDLGPAAAAPVTAAAGGGTASAGGCGSSCACH